MVSCVAARQIRHQFCWVDLNSVVELLIAGTGLSFGGFVVLRFVAFFDSLIAGALGLGGGALRSGI